MRVVVKLCKGRQVSTLASTALARLKLLRVSLSTYSA